MGFTIKICGVRDAETARVAVEAGADRLGLVFFEKSPRHLAFEGAGAVVADIRRFAPDVRVVGLMVDPPDDEAQAAVGAGVDELQLHGRETPDRLGEIRRLTERPVWKALGVSSPADAARAGDYASVAAGVFFDAKPAAADDRPGGLGRRFDLAALEGYDGAAPWVLSGGLDPDNVAGAVAAARAIPGFAGVDVSSGVESAPGVKDHARIREFVRAARAAMGA